MVDDPTVGAQKKSAMLASVPFHGMIWLLKPEELIAKLHDLDEIIMAMPELTPDLAAALVGVALMGMVAAEVAEDSQGNMAA